jgi:hypothetical protein
MLAGALNCLQQAVGCLPCTGKGGKCPHAAGQASQSTSPTTLTDHNPPPAPQDDISITIVDAAGSLLSTYDK